MKAERFFVDTSAIFALIAADDRRHDDAVRTWDALTAQGACYAFTSNYVVAETYDLVRRRMGFEALRAADGFIREFIDVSFVTRELHDRGREALFKRSSRDLSLVDCISFAVARAERADAVFAYDQHFENEGFALAADS